MEVSVIIPNWNGRELLEKHLPAVLEAAGNPKNKIREIIIVDDKSTDDSVAFLEKNFKKQIRIIRHTQNRGFSAGVNNGARAAKGALLCLINTDVSPSRNFLEAVLPHFANNQVFAVSLHEKGYGYAKGKFENGFIVYEGQKETNQVKETFWVNGGSGVFRRTTWMRLKGMDEKLLSPLYWEDVDLGYRAQKRGFRLLWEPKATIFHEHESTVKKLKQTWLKRTQERNQLLFIWKNLTSPNLFKKHLRGLARRLRRHPGYLLIILMAVKRLKAVRAARKKEKKEAKVSDETIFAKWT